MLKKKRSRRLHKEEKKKGSVNCILEIKTSLLVFKIVLFSRVTIKSLKCVKLSNLLSFVTFSILAHKVSKVYKMITPFFSFYILELFFQYFHQSTWNVELFSKFKFRK